MKRQMKFGSDLSTTAMGIMPHEDADRALEMALVMDIPFWPQLPRLAFYEDMYVQALERFPGAVLDLEHNRVHIDTAAFMEELPYYIEHEEDPGYLALSEQFSAVYRRFLEMDLSAFKSVRGQVISPVSFTLKITDENGRPIVYNDEIRAFAFSFIQKKVNAQYKELIKKNERSFVWVDDPGLEFVFSAMCGYDNIKAKKELTGFFDGIEGPRGLHLCGRPDWDFLLTLNIEILSFNAYAFGEALVGYDTAKSFLQEGGVICWGIVPTYYDEFTNEDLESLVKRLEGIWGVLIRKGLDMESIARNSLLAPATCNLMNVDKTTTVERSFELLGELSHRLKERYLP